MKVFFTLLAISLGVAASAQENENSLSPFTRIDIFGPFKAELIKSDQDAIAIDGTDRHHIVREVRNGELHLKFKNKHYIDRWTSEDYPRSQYINAKIYYTELSEIHAQAGAEVFSGDILKARTLNLDCSMGAKMDLEVLSQKLYIKASMGAIIELEGATENLEVKASMGGVINAKRLASNTTLVSARMGAEVNVNASEEIEVNAGFGAMVNYSGDPAVRHAHKNFGAEVRGN